jgi:hypothetical protein
LLDINKEPQKSYMSDFEGKVSRAIKKHRTRLQLLPGPATYQPPDKGTQKEISAFRIMEEEMMDGLTSVSQAGSTASRMSKGPALLHKLKSKQSKKAKATAIINVVGHSDITSNPKAVARAGIVWSQIEKARCEYQSILDEAFDALEGSDGLAEALVDNENQWDWLLSLESKLEELMIMRVSPEKGGGANADPGFMEEKMEPRSPRECPTHGERMGQIIRSFFSFKQRQT